jgi:hypothetical protein
MEPQQERPNYEPEAADAVRPAEDEGAGSFRKDQALPSRWF